MSAEPRSNFLRTQIQDDLDSGRASGVITRFPPEPNGSYILAMPSPLR